ncbi:MAG TPA: sigma factor [Methylomirabilota bacterium]|nr:sigma factor [Methylomirabilota bacterium]
MDLLQLFPLNPEKEERGECCADDFLEHPIVFVERFWKWRESLFLVAHRVLGDRKAATDAVELCFRRSCANPPKFVSDGAFGSWVLRIVIDESLQERRRRRWAPKGHCHQTLTRVTGREEMLRQLDDFWCLDTSL